MGYANNKITAPVSIFDVKSVVPVTLRRTNTSTGQIETISSSDLGVLCGASVGDTIPATDGNGSWTVLSRTEANMWARYKPETAVTGLVTLGIQPITLQNRTLNGYGIECRSNAGVGSISTLVDRLRAGTAVDCFTYKKPFGTSASPYRLTDFEKYWHLATVPIRAPYNPTDKIGVTSQGTLQLYYYVDIEGSTYGLGLKDLRFQSDSQQLSEYYFGILIYNSTTYAAATQDHKMGSAQQEGLDVTLTGVPQTTATYQMVPFFSTQPITSASASFNGTIYPMIWAGQEIHTAAESQYIAISTWGFVWDNGMQTVRFKYSVVNRTSGAHTFNTEAYGAGTSYIEVGYQGMAMYQRWPVQINVSVPANSEVSNTVVIAQNLYAAQAELIRNGDSKVHISAAQFNGRYTYDDIIQVWEHE